MSFANERGGYALSEILRPEWPTPVRVHALFTTRAFGDIAQPEMRAKLRRLLPAEPAWLRQVHGTTVVDADIVQRKPEADASYARKPSTVCAVLAADCMPVLLADAGGTVVGAAHAGWRGLAAGVIEATVRAMGVAPQALIAWLGPAIGPQAYEVGEDVHAALRGYERAFTRAARGGHWLLDLYAVARERLTRCGVSQIHGGGLCTYSEPERFFSYRRDRTASRMAALVWLT
jgi:YfiH family protein